jgi:hypothetical protein
VPHVASKIFNNGFESPAKATLKQTPDMLHVLSKAQHMAPPTRTVGPGRILGDVGVDALPVLNLAAGGDKKLEATGLSFIVSTPKVLDHDGRRVANSGAKHLAWDPHIVESTLTPEELHLAGFEDCNNVEVTHTRGVVHVEPDIGLHERWAALYDAAAGRDCLLKTIVASMGVTSKLYMACMSASRDIEPEILGEGKWRKYFSEVTKNSSDDNDKRRVVRLGKTGISLQPSDARYALRIEPAWPGLREVPMIQCTGPRDVNQLEVTIEGRAENNRLAIDFAVAVCWREGSHEDPGKRGFTTSIDLRDAAGCIGAEEFEVAMCRTISGLEPAIF